jgi:hypothetical protein
MNNSHHPRKGAVWLRHREYQWRKLAMRNQAGCQGPNTEAVLLGSFYFTQELYDIN